MNPVAPAARALRRCRDFILQFPNSLRLRAAVASHVAVLPVVSNQLRDTSRQIETAVNEVCGGFESIVGKARESVAEAERILGRADGTMAIEEEAGGGISGVIQTSRSTLESLLDRIVKDSEASLAAIDRMGAIEREMAAINKALAEVDRIAFGNTILALNARIEAAHLGEQGQGFEIVAQELWNQARKSDHITAAIRETISRLGADVDGTLGGLKQMALADRRKIDLSRREVENALEQIEQTHRRMQESLTDSAARSEALATAVGNAVMAMQFQDRVNQRIAHVIEALTSMHDALAAPLGGGVPAAPAGQQAEAVERLESRYTMAAERTVQSATLGTGTAPGEAAEGDIELF